MSRIFSHITAYGLVGSSLLMPFSLMAEFSNHVAESGLDHIQADSKNTKHGGASAVDVNGDGYTDILVARDEKSPLLFINQGNGTFSEEASTRGIGNAQNVGGFGAGDFDNDGDQDIFITPRVGNRYYLFINNGSGIFSEEALVRGAAVETTIEPHRGYSVGIVDFDLDGYLDIYVSEWGVPSNDDNAKHSVLLRNRGEAQAAYFENVTEQAGLTQPNNRNMHFGFSSGWGDLDGDGWPDLVLVSDFGTSKMYWNNGNGTFTESTNTAGMGLDENGMGIAIIDYDQDGLLDIFVSSIHDRFSINRDGTATGNKLYRNIGNRIFEETATEAGVARTGWGWGASFFEYDNDGDSDLIVTNGSIVSAGLNPVLNPYVDAVDDPTTLLLNQSNGSFINRTVAAGLTDRDLGKAIVVFDYEKDGDEDLFITNSGDHPILYRSDASGNGNNYLRLSFEGTDSNRDGYGCIVKLVTADRIQTQLYNPSNAYIGQRESYLHFGLGTANIANTIELIWPSGMVQTLENVVANQVLEVVEPEVSLEAPVFGTQPTGGDFEKGDTLTLVVDATGAPAPVYVWEKDGVAIDGATGAEFRIKRLHPYDAGVYRAKAINQEGSEYSDEVTVTVTTDISGKSVARVWNEFLLDAIRKDFPDPTIHSRNLFHTSAAMWDAFWAYDDESWARASEVFHKETPSSADWGGDREAAQAEAISYAAYRVLTERYKNSPGRERSLFGFRWLMEELGYDPDFTGTADMSPAAVGNRIGYNLLAIALNDGSNEGNGYVDTSGYRELNEPLILELSGTTLDEPNHWQPLAFEYLITQNGIVIGQSVQTFLGVNWREVDTFAIEKTSSNTIAIDPGPPPNLGTDSEAEFIEAAVDVIRYSAMLDPSDDVMIDVSPGGRLNNTLGTNDGIGRTLNPFTGQPYEPNMVKRADYGRILAEFWADGPASETPPGHWNTLHNEITEHPLFERRYGGVGELLDPLEWDIQAYLAINGAMHDAAVAAWTLKRQYDYVRPISIIRYLGALGQSSDPDGLSYHPKGITLEDGLIEVITEESSTAGQRHEHLASYVGEIAIKSWAGEPEDAESGVGGVDWIRAIDWMPYQRSTFVTPAFAAYVSGHSTFSRAAAEVMTLLTGSPFFPGGLGSFHFGKDEFLEFENGPSDDVTLEWATYYDAADQAGISRLYGGIHVAADDVVGRVLGARVGLDAFLMADRLRSGADLPLGLINISTRGLTGRGDDRMVAGFVVEGGASEGILLRSVGPELANYGIENFEADPEMDLRRSGFDEPVLSNDNWGESANRALIEFRADELGAFDLGDSSKDSAEVVDLEEGVYTLAVQPASSETLTTVLAEVYGTKMVNISTRAKIDPAQGNLVGGFVIECRDPRPLLIRAVGPSLEEFDVEDFLPDPVLEIYRHLPDGSKELVARNGEWSLDDKASLSEVCALRVGAFPLISGSNDAAIFVQLPAGIYSAVVQSGNGQAGISLIEVYNAK